MPGLVRKLLIFAAVDGLVLQPLTQKGQRPASSSKISFKDGSIVPSGKEDVPNEARTRGFEAFGIVGLLTVAKTTYLISITRRRQVAQVRGKPIYIITDVALTPLASHGAAEAAIVQTRVAIHKGERSNQEDGDSDAGSEEEGFFSGTNDEIDDDNDSHSAPNYPTSIAAGHKRTSSVAEDVMARKGGYGRFAQKWFSSKGWTVDQKRNLGMTAAGVDNNTIPTEPVLLRGSSKGHSDAQEASSSAPFQTTASDLADNLLPKLLRTTKLLFGTSQSFYFSYEYDITRSLARQPIKVSERPLYSQVDPLYFWNRNIILPFISAGQHSLVLPLMQGFVGQRSFEMDTAPPNPFFGHESAEKSSVELTDFSVGGEVDQHRFDDSEPKNLSNGKDHNISFCLTLISRRSVKRAGLRYLRRGVDDEGNTANSVETEQILSDTFWTASKKVQSFVQIRGSIPVFFSQTPYSFKPIPLVQHSEETNYQAFSKHFQQAKDRYGDVQVVSLVEKHGNEAIVGEKYEKHMERLNKTDGIERTPIGFEWFDFHAICRGMKFENVSILMDAIGDKLDSFGYTVEVDGTQTSKQHGVLRTNCMDCLDRTNVVQSACGRRALEMQLKDEGIDMSLQVDQTTQWFNTLWADNGDAISKQYASTAALKGDFTRTRKRDYKGALTDMGLSISRFYSGIVNDYFSQAAIDFLLGNVTSVVFQDFEANLMSVDPAVSMQKMRQQAIETCQKLVVADQHEEFIAGWALLTPHAANTIKSMPFEESVLLLTDAALYCCKFDWNIEKVSSFERVELQHITKICYGAYIISTLSPSQADERTNVGFVVTYKAGSDDITRVNTRSMSSLQSRNETDSKDPAHGYPTSGLTSFLNKPASMTDTPPRVLAMKALPSKSAVLDTTEGHLSEIELVQTICSEIERMILHGQVVESGTERRGIVESGDIISLADAKRSTGILEQLGHSIKKLVWA